MFQGKINLFGEKLLLGLFACLLLEVSCTRNPYDVEVSDIDFSLECIRLDELLFEAPINEVKEVNRELLAQHANCYKLYLEEILRLGSIEDSLSVNRLQSFLATPIWQDTWRDVASLFGDFSKEKNELEQGFRHYLYHFPSAKLPKVFTYHSGYNFGLFPTEEAIGIGLEWYLGEENEIIQRLAPSTFPLYIKRKMDRKYLSTDAIKAWLMYNYKDIHTEEKLLDQMLFFGKVMLLMDACFPTVEDSIKINYTSAQIDWCKENERYVWQQIVGEELLFKRDLEAVQRFLQEGPFTSGFPRECPPQLGIWVGWQMVRSFARKNSDLTLKEVIDEKNHNAFLKTYKPDK